MTLLQSLTDEQLLAVWQKYRAAGRNARLRACERWMERRYAVISEFAKAIRKGREAETAPMDMKTEFLNRNNHDK